MNDSANLSASWQEFLFSRISQRIADGQPIPEDARSADWRFFLSLREDQDVLVIGGGWGTIPVALAESCRKVFVLDSNPENVRFLKERCAEKPNIKVDFLSSSWKLPFPENGFHLVSVPRPTFSDLTFTELLTNIRPFIHPGGYLHVNISNRLNFQNLIRNGNGASSLQQTYSGIPKILIGHGFSDIQIFTPLPHSNGIPMFYLPCDNKKAWRFFFKNIFPLFAAVSPEVKKIYSLEYALAKIIVWMVLLLRLEGVVKHFSPGFTVIAKYAS